MALVVAVIALLCAQCTVQGFQFANNALKSVRASGLRMSTDAQVPLALESIALSGVSSKAKNYADPDLVINIHAKEYFKTIRALTDDIPFARKRLLTPKTVYSGLADMLEFTEAKDSGSLETALKGMDAWIAYGLTPEELKTSASLAAKIGLKRVVFAVQVPEDMRGENVVFADACSQMASAGVKYTIVKYAETHHIKEARFPYRIVRDVLPIPGPTTPADPRLSSGPVLADSDLRRVLFESVDIPKTYNSVYGMGPGTQLDTEILVYMKSQGWPERVQVGMLTGDLMERLEQMFVEEGKSQKAAKEAKKLPAGPPPTVDPSVPTQSVIASRYKGLIG